MNRNLIKFGGYTIGYRRSSWHAFLEVLTDMAIAIVIVLCIALVAIGGYMAYFWA